MNHKRNLLITTVVLLLMTLGCTGWFAYSIFPSMLAGYQAQVANQLPISAAELVANSENIDEEYLAIEGLEIVGEPLELKRTSLNFCDFVLVKAPGPRDEGMPKVIDSAEGNEEAILIFNNREKTDQSIAGMIRQGQLKGKFYAHSDDLSPANVADLEQHFPDLDLASTRLVGYQRPLPAWLFWGICGIFALQPFSMAWLVYSLVFKKNKLLDGESWEQKIHDDRTKLYRSSQKAMRLIDHETYFNGSLQQRTVDASYDVPATKKTTRRKTKHLTLVIAGIVANGLLVGGISYFQHSSDFLAGIGKTGVQFLMLIPLAIMGSLIGAIRKRVVRRDEEKLPLAKATYRELDFYKYHAQVLAELGFVEIGDYKQIGIPTQLVRTIFLNPKGNLLIEIGLDFGRPFFTLESLTNSGVLLETHSLIGPKHELTDISKAHLRQSALHLDIVQALEDHDELVAGVTFTGAIMEGKFTAENFGRFLSFPFQGK